MVRKLISAIRGGGKISKLRRGKFQWKSLDGGQTPASDFWGGGGQVLSGCDFQICTAPSAINSDSSLMALIIQLDFLQLGLQWNWFALLYFTLQVNPDDITIYNILTFIEKLVWLGIVN